MSFGLTIAHTIGNQKLGVLFEDYFEKLQSFDWNSDSGLVINGLYKNGL